MIDILSIVTIITYSPRCGFDRLYNSCSYFMFDFLCKFIQLKQEHKLRNDIPSTFE